LKVPRTLDATAEFYSITPFAPHVIQVPRDSGAAFADNVISVTYQVTDSTDPNAIETYTVNERHTVKLVHPAKIELKGSNRVCR